MRRQHGRFEQSADTAGKGGSQMPTLSHSRTAESNRAIPPSPRQQGGWSPAKPFPGQQSHWPHKAALSTTPYTWPVSSGIAHFAEMEAFWSSRLHTDGGQEANTTPPGEAAISDCSGFQSGVGGTHA